MKIFMIACEPSGDSHGAALIRELKAQKPDAVFSGLGGPQMQAAGAQLLHDMTQISALGFGDVLRQYFQYRKIFYAALDQIRAVQPDALIVIDSPAFNLRFVKKIKKQFPTFYYISPQLWAWAMGRIRIIQKHVSKMLVILPFEKKLYDRYQVPCDFVGHPLLDHLKVSAARETLRARLGLNGSAAAVGLLAGSRAKEVQRILPIMLASARELKKHMPDVRFFTRLAPNIDPALYDAILRRFPEIEIQRPEMSLHDLVTALDFALVTSGTATLETALLGTPFFLLYKASGSTYFLGKHLIRVPYLGLVNLLAERSVVPEFIQSIDPSEVARQAEELLRDTSKSESMRKAFSEVRALLGAPGASRRAAESILRSLGH